MHAKLCIESQKKKMWMGPSCTKHNSNKNSNKNVYIQVFKKSLKIVKMALKVIGTRIVIRLGYNSWLK